MVAPGWYQAPGDPPTVYRWWDGVYWTEVTHVAQGDAAPSVGDRELAPLFHRVVARVLDVIILEPVARAVNSVWLRAFADEERVVFVNDDPFAQPNGWLTGLADGEYAMIMALVSLAVAAIWEVVWLATEGATPGKQLMGLYVRDVTNHEGRVEPLTAIKRSIHRPLGVIPFGFVALAALSTFSFWLLANDREQRQSVMDRVAGTVVHRLPPGSPRWTPWFLVWFVVVLVLSLLAPLLGALMG